MNVRPSFISTLILVAKLVPLLMAASCTAGSFNLSAPPSASLAQGSSATIAVQITTTNGFSSPVTLSTSGLPSGVTASFIPNPAPGASSAVTLTATSGAGLGSATVTISGQGGGDTKTVTLTLSVTTANAALPSGVWDQSNWDGATWQ